MGIELKDGERPGDTAHSGSVPALRGRRLNWYSPAGQSDPVRLHEATIAPRSLPLRLAGQRLVFAVHDLVVEPAEEARRPVARNPER